MSAKKLVELTADELRARLEKQQARNARAQARRRAAQKAQGYRTVTTSLREPDKGTETIVPVAVWIHKSWAKDFKNFQSGPEPWIPYIDRDDKNNFVLKFYKVPPKE